jgi:zinc protease
VNIKSTQFEKSVARTLIRFGGGMLELPADKAGLQLFAQTVFIAGGLEKVSLPELNRQIGDKNVGIMFAVGDDAFQLGGPCMSSSMELQLQVCAAYLTAPAYAPETERQFFDVMENLDTQRTHTMEGMLRYDAAAFLRNDDARYRLPHREEIRRLKLADVQAWLAEPLARGYLEVTIVGDVDPENTLTALAKTLGALPQRDAEKPQFESAKHLAFPTMKTKEFRFESDAPRAATAVCWQVPGYDDVTASRRTVLLSQVLADRVRRKIREELGVAYTPSVDYVAGEAFPKFGFVAAQVCVDPANLTQVGPLLAEVATDLANGEISDDEFQRALQPLLSGIDAQRQDNNYWLTAISDCQSRPSALDAIRSKREGYAKIGKAEVGELARTCLKTDRAVTVSVAPAKAK